MRWKWCSPKVGLYECEKGIQSWKNGPSLPSRDQVLAREREKRADQSLDIATRPFPRFAALKYEMNLSGKQKGKCKSNWKWQSREIYRTSLSKGPGFNLIESFSLFVPKAFLPLENFCPLGKNKKI